MKTSSGGGQARRGVTAAGNGLLTLAAIGGVICIVFVILAVFFHITLIMFKTGSMSPTIPTGSLSVVRQVPASEVVIGDVVTVDRPGALPITHRVTSITPTGHGVMSITLRGDANATEDPAPYLVSTVRIVMFSVPGLAYAVAAASNPLVLGAITLGAAGIVTWAFWPRDAAAGGIPKRTRPPALAVPLTAAPERVTPGPVTWGRPSCSSWFCRVRPCCFPGAPRRPLSRKTPSRARQ